MSFCRFTSDSDAYCYKDIRGNYVCCACLLSEKYSIRFDTLMELKEHLKEHVKVGHKIPDCTFEYIDTELGIK